MFIFDILFHSVGFFMPCLFTSIWVTVFSFLFFEKGEKSPRDSTIFTLVLFCGAFVLLGGFLMSGYDSRPTTLLIMIAVQSFIQSVLYKGFE